MADTLSMLGFFAITACTQRSIFASFAGVSPPADFAMPYGTVRRLVRSAAR
jgi:hypothetical protein